ncbi:hypothetical protein PAAG_11625 [Paracoccidioides lutzii Pb01]|uniref:Uncharacterized protein n=1 Tax=Paracoccidioides lutzii (strain ATCC MYA-826 / Pb01) TaxID=502779 RepID=A0A0A2V5P5_PARBA|nr:hypothetical protein PAAG_11625 [Paracoccidioides lutzii Pb01]KGQ01642.1 hypothetical protein PAAG_11625 [Paracoccidioides lutzii Pb01]
MAVTSWEASADVRSPIHWVRCGHYGRWGEWNSPITVALDRMKLSKIVIQLTKIGAVQCRWWVSETTYISIQQFKTQVSAQQRLERARQVDEIHSQVYADFGAGIYPWLKVRKSISIQSAVDELIENQ